MNEHAFLLPLKIGSILIPLASQEDQHLTLAINSADSCVGFSIWFWTSIIKWSINELSIALTSSSNEFLLINPFLPRLFTVISLAISVRHVYGAGSFFNVEKGRVEFGFQISSDVFCINLASNFKPKSFSSKLIPLPRYGNLLSVLIRMLDFINS